MTVAARASDAIEVALVNNMPDQALAATQLQFARLAQIGAEGQRINWRCYTLPSHKRSETARRYLERSHEDIEALYRRGADALIVTGAEPRADNLREEPFWEDFQRLVDWARTSTTSTIWSCLAAHAAVLYLDGVERRRMNKKLSGVFQCEVIPDDWRGSDRARKILTPHSRYNDLPRQALEERGYRVASQSPLVGVDSFWRREPSLFIFLQGHPEYDADTLMKEYRRDVLRFVSGERDDYPDPPMGCFNRRATTRLERLREQAIGNCDTRIEAELNAILSGEKYRSSWAGDASGLYRDWMKTVACERKDWRDSA